MPRDSAGEEDQQANPTWNEYLKTAPAWLVSAVVHMTLIVALAAWWIYEPSDDALVMTMGEGEKTEVFEQLDDFNALVETPDMQTLITPQHLDPVENPFAAPPKPDVSLNATSSVPNITAPQIGMALSGRDEGSRAWLVKKGGGNFQSERAVELALAWIARQQRSDGSWSLKGPYEDVGLRENQNAATAMALLAFQGAGNTHQKGKYKTNVDKGMKWLISRQSTEGGFDTGGISSHENFYTHGQCLIALCELYAMTGDSWIRGPAEQAVDFAVRYQADEGGWRYQKGSDSDTSVTGWVLMGLQSARMGGLDVPQETFDNIGKYLDLAGNPNGSRYGYLVSSQHTPTMTAEGLLCREYLGWDRDHPALNDGVDYLVTRMNLPSREDPNVYYWYYATQVLHHMEGPRWDKWNGVMRNLLVDTQVDGGRNKGSWSPVTGDTTDQWGAHAGRLFQTCLSVYILEVYYRHLPIYASKDGKFNVN